MDCYGGNQICFTINTYFKFWHTNLMSYWISSTRQDLLGWPFLRLIYTLILSLIFQEGDFPLMTSLIFCLDVGIQSALAIVPLLTEKLKMLRPLLKIFTHLPSSPWVSHCWKYCSVVTGMNDLVLPLFKCSRERVLQPLERHLRYIFRSCTFGLLCKLTTDQSHSLFPLQLWPVLIAILSLYLFPKTLKSVLAFILSL